MRAVEPVEEAGLEDELERREARRHGHRVAGERPGLVDRPERRDLLHDVAPAAERADRHPAADHLAEGREVRRDAVEPLCAARADPKAGHHLVEDQHRAVLRAERAQRLQELARPRHEVHVAGHRLDDHRRDLVALPAECVLELLHVVEREHRGVTGGLRRHAGRARVAERERARARLHEQRVGVAVVAAFELDDAGAAGEPAREAERGHRRLGARGHEPHERHARQRLAEQLRELDLERGRRAERESFERRLAHGRDDQWVRVPEDERPPGADVVDVALAVGVPEVRAFAAFEEARRAADGAERAHRRVHAPGDDGLRLLEQLVVAGHAAAFLRKRSEKARARAAMSPASNSAVMTASGIGAGGDGLRRVLERDAPDRDDRDAEPPRRAEQRERRADRGRLGRGSEHRSEGDVVGACSNGTLGELEPVVARRAEQPARTEAPACGGEIAVIASEVDAGGVDRERELDIVVHQQRDAGSAAKRRERARLLAPERRIRRLVAVLDRRRPAGDRGAHLGDERGGVRLVGRERVEPGRKAGRHHSSAVAAAARNRNSRSGMAWPRPGRNASARVCQVKPCAARTASGTGSPYARPAAIAAASVQPDPW